jgi:hypothetical protein
MNLQLVIIVVGLLATIATSLWGIHMNNARYDKLESKVDTKIDTLRSEVNQRFDGLQRDFNQFYLHTGRLEGRMDTLEKRGN